jgi:hypothetical protein
MKRNSKKQKGDGNEGLNISKENGIENGIHNHDDDKECMNENDILEMNHKNDNNTNKENTDNNDDNDVNTTSEGLALNGSFETPSIGEYESIGSKVITPQTVDSQGILNLFYLHCIIFYIIMLMLNACYK